MLTIIEQPTSQLELFSRKFVLRATGLDVVGEPTFEEWLSYGEALKTLENTARQFAIGDWIVQGSTGMSTVSGIRCKMCGAKRHYPPCNNMRGSPRRSNLGFESKIYLGLTIERLLTLGYLKTNSAIG